MDIQIIENTIDELEHSDISMNNAIELASLYIIRNNNLTGMTMEQINLDMITKMKEQAGERSQVVDLVLNEVAEAIRANQEDLQIYTEGATNIFKYPELSDGQKASKLLSTLEQKELLKNLFTENEDGEKKNEIQVYIGDETPVESMKDCSVVTANYVLGDGLRGSIGIVGPKRMDYDKVVSTLRSLMSQLEDTFKDEER